MTRNALPASIRGNLYEAIRYIHTADGSSILLHQWQPMNPERNPQRGSLEMLSIIVNS